MSGGVASAGAPSAAGHGPGPGPAPAFFIDSKRGEVNELKMLLNNPRLLKEQDKRREVIKKVIAYMTLGIDVSKVFSEMVMAASTKDLVQKKMVYHYLCSYAQQKADLAILAINTLQKDSRDEDPMVRGLALRSLCSLRIANIGEYVMIPLRQSLNDPSAYVRKTAVLGIAKLFQFVPESIRKTDLVDILYNMLKDKDTQVITNVIHTLNEILATEGPAEGTNGTMSGGGGGAGGGGGMAINHAIMLHLLNRIKEFNEWGQCLVLELAAKYTPKDENAIFDIMNLLEDRLKHSNSAVVLGTTKVFLNYTANMPRVHEEVYKRLKAPLLTLMTGGSNELAFVILSHIYLLVQRRPSVFTDSYKHMYCRFNDPPPVKIQKLAIITQLATPSNMIDILLELSEYVTDLDTELSRFAVRAIGKISIRIPESADECIEHLLSFLQLDAPHVTSETVIVLKDFLRKYPQRYQDVIPSLSKVLNTIEETEGKIACIWMVGEYGETIEEAPYILEPLIDAFHEEADNLVNMELLTATMKLFFKRPPELQKMLAKLLKMAIKDPANDDGNSADPLGLGIGADSPSHAATTTTTQSNKIMHVDVRDRALLYYRLLQYDVHDAASVVNSGKAALGAGGAAGGVDGATSKHSLLFTEQIDEDLISKLFAEFNSLSIIYNIPQERFVKAPVFDEEEEKKKEREEQAKAEAQSSSAALTAGEEVDASHAGEGEESTAGAGAGTAGAGAGHAPSTPQQSSTGGTTVDLLGDFMGGLDVSSSSPTSSTPTSTSAPSLHLLPNQTLDRATYSQKWSSLPVSGAVEVTIRSRPIQAQRIEQCLTTCNLITFASGTVGNMIKLFLFGRDESGSLYLIEMNIDTVSGDSVAKIKTDSPNADNNVATLQQIMRTALQTLC